MTITMWDEQEQWFGSPTISMIHRRRQPQPRMPEAEAVGSTQRFGKSHFLMPVLCKRQNPDQDHERLKSPAGKKSFGQDEQDRQDAEEETGSGPSCESCPSCPKSPDGMSCTKRRISPNDPKLSDCGGRRSLCGKAAGAGLRAGAQAVTPAAVRCSALSGIAAASSCWLLAAHHLMGVASGNL